jgi:hypothetical protein
MTSWKGKRFGQRARAGSFQMSVDPRAALLRVRPRRLVVEFLLLREQLTQPADKALQSFHFLRRSLARVDADLNSGFCQAPAQNKFLNVLNSAEAAFPAPHKLPMQGTCFVLVLVSVRGLLVTVTPARVLPWSPPFRVSIARSPPETIVFVLNERWSRTTGATGWLGLMSLLEIPITGGLPLLLCWCLPSEAEAICVAATRKRATQITSGKRRRVLRTIMSHLLLSACSRPVDDLVTLRDSIHHDRLHGRARHAIEVRG